ncbi:MAG: DUF512 domain-containing protein [Clostridiales bacterium]|nr:DUF512 domain-containing protein [Clostridiales bacterium]
MDMQVRDIPADSPCAGLLLPGDRLLAIDGYALADVLDYMHHSAAGDPLLTVLRGQRRLELRVKKARYADLDLTFERFLMDDERSCDNNCLFCFVDQLPKGMRETLYFKDDDARLSFLMGNYISLTNLSEREVSRMIDYRISPINVSVHTTNPSLRSLMLGNPKGGESLGYLRRFAQAGLSLNCQIVACSGLNDGEELSRTLCDLLDLGPSVDSIAVVPAGLTAHRQGLYPLEPFTQAQAQDLCRRVLAAGERALGQTGRRTVYPSDELLLQAGLPIPDYDFYEEFLQLENGVGMLAMLCDEVEQALPGLIPPPAPRRVTGVTGTLAAPTLSKLFDAVVNRCHNRLAAALLPVENDFFGRTITVAGLVTGRDILRRLQGRQVGDALLVPAAMLRYDRACFLDDLSVEALERAVGAPVAVVENSGAALIAALTGQPVVEFLE